MGSVAGSFKRGECPRGEAAQPRLLIPGAAVHAMVKEDVADAVSEEGRNVSQVAKDAVVRALQGPRNVPGSQ